MSKANDPLELLLIEEPAWLDVVEYARALSATSKSPTVAPMPEYVAWMTDNAIRYRLRRAGMPDSPAMVQRVLATIQGREGPPPTRGLLVTTRAFLQVDHNGQMWFHDANPEITIGRTQWAVQGLSDKAITIAAKHRLKLEPSGRNRLRDKKAIAQATAGASVGSLDRTTDYWEELRDTELLKILAGDIKIDPLARDIKIRQYCSKAGDRVRKRRESKDLDTRKPVRWEQRASTFVAKWLRDNNRHHL
jgi:hypothetical protein